MRSKREKINVPTKPLVGEQHYNFKRVGDSITGFAANVQDDVDEAQALYNFGFGKRSSMSSVGTPTTERTINFFKTADADEVEKKLLAAKFTKE